MNASDVKRDDWIVLGLGLLLVVDLIALPWFHITVSTSAGSNSYQLSFSSAATGAPDGWLGVLALIAVLLLMADLLVERLSPQTALPNIGGSRTTTRFFLAAIAAALLVLKFLLHIHFGLFGFGFWAAVVLTVALVYATRRLSNDQSVLPA